MTYPPSMLLPSVAVYVDGKWVADGRNPYSTDPQVLTGLVVRWGRSTVVDQPQPSTCGLTLLDTQGGSRFLDTIQLGMRLDVMADALLSDDPGPGTGLVVIDETFTSGPGNAYVGGVGSIAAVGGVLTLTSAGEQSVSVTVPPGAREPVGGNPAAWDGIPRAAQGQTWAASVDVKLPAPFAGYSGWAVQVYPVAYETPWDTALALDELGTRADLGNGWVRVSGEFVPPTGAWLGVQVRLWPIGPAWDDLPPGPGTRTNLATNPAPATANWWATNDGTKYTHAYVAGEIQVTRTATGDPNVAASLLALGNNPYNPVLTAGVTYQRSVEIWVDQAATVAPTLAAGAWVGGQALPANTWTRVVETFTGTGVAQYVMCLGVRIPGVGPGMHVKLRRALLVAIPDGQPVDYFDGSTPDTPAWDYAWTGAANASTSTATGLGVAVTWDELGRLAIDNVSLKAPAGGTLRSGIVFSGRITDMVARFDDTAGGTLVDITGADQRSELGNRDVGDTPWSEETLGARFGRIVTESGQAIESRVSATAAAMMVSWRDVDRQPAMTLLSELATSADGVLWAATHPTTGPYLLLESLADRPAMFVLTRGADLMVVIRTKTAAEVGALEIDACDILLEPIRWRHDIGDMATKVAVTWREQTTSEGLPAPTDRTVTVTNTVLETEVGVHRIAIGTQLSKQADATLVADAVLARTSNTQWRVSGLDWRADTTDQLDADALGRMMTLLDGTARNGLPIMLTNVPDWSPIPDDQDVPLYLEGGVYTSTDGGWDLSLITSSAKALGKAEVAWDDLPAATVDRTNLATNPRAVSSGANGWVASRGFGTGGAGAYSYITGQTGPAGTGISTAQRKTWTTGSSTNDSTGFQIQDTTTRLFAITPGVASVTVSIWVRYSAPTARTLKMILQWFNKVAWDGGGFIIQSNAPTVAGPAANVWQRLTYTVAPPAGALGLLVFPDLAAGGTNWAAGQTLDMTGLMIEESAAVGGFFDGDTPDVAGSTDYAWTGTANASPSRATDMAAWQWDQFDPAITWNDLHGVGI